MAPWPVTKMNNVYYVAVRGCCKTYMRLAALLKRIERGERVVFLLEDIEENLYAYEAPNLEEAKRRLREEHPEAILRGHIPLEEHDLLEDELLSLEEVEVLFEDEN